MRQLQGADMAGRTFQMTTHRVVDQSLIGRDLAPPTRRVVAFGVDVGLLAVPTILAALCCAALSLRITDRPAFDAVRALAAGEVRTEAATVDVMAALLPRLVAIGADGLPLEAITAVKAGRARDGAHFVKDADIELSLTFSDDQRSVKPGAIRVNVLKFVPGVARGAALFGVPAIYFTLLGLTAWSTLGKRLLGIEVCRLDGQRPTLMASFDRFGGYAQVPGTLFFGLTDLWRDPNRRLAHDRGANTVVLRCVPSKWR